MGGWDLFPRTLIQNSCDTRIRFLKVEIDFYFIDKVHDYIATQLLTETKERDHALRLKHCFNREKICQKFCDNIEKATKFINFQVSLRQE